ncbi:MAG: type II toxin-antitoxin system YafQ family toxin [Prevotellaceae bacterium]|jgi:hypothetical protein|nr:type II toxin-antitoxin system YafQ family toxin [Prevotellaceae bacterium]
MTTLTLTVDDSSVAGEHFIGLLEECHLQPDWLPIWQQNDTYSVDTALAGHGCIR